MVDHFIGSQDGSIGATIGIGSRVIFEVFYWDNLIGYISSVGLGRDISRDVKIFAGCQLGGGMIAFISEYIKLSDFQVFLNLKDHGFEGMGIIDITGIEGSQELMFSIAGCLNARLNPSERYGRMM